MKNSAALWSSVLSLVLSCAVHAQSNDKPIKVVVPYPAGGIADSLARVISVPLATALGTAVIVENKSGAAGAIGATFVKNAAPDGTTLLFTNVGPSAIAPAMSTVQPYDPSRDFVAVSLVSKSPLILAVPASSSIKDTQSLIAAAKAKPASIEYSSAGIGSFGHLSTELFAQSAGIQLLHVPYQGGNPATMAVLSGEVKMTLTAPSAQMFEMAKSGKVRLLGVTTRGPSQLVQGIPSIADVIPGFESQYWFGFVAPARTNDAVVQRLHDAIDKILADPAVGRQILAMGNEVGSGTSAEFQKLIDSEWLRWRAVVKSAKIDTTN
jgi:tripartite-type tricarboxylate transporter receptor subunit TctC